MPQPASETNPRKNKVLNQSYTMKSKQSIISVSNTVCVHTMRHSVKKSLTEETQIFSFVQVYI